MKRAAIVLFVGLFFINDKLFGLDPNPLPPAFHPFSGNPADLDRNERIDQTDVNIFDFAFNNDNSTADLNEDGVVNNGDKFFIQREFSLRNTSGQSTNVPLGPSLVRTVKRDRRLLVQDRLYDGNLGPEYAFVARGVNWSPHTSGASELDLHKEYEKWYQTDIPLMAQAGINVVRVYHDFGTTESAKLILDEFYRYGIKVIVQVDSPNFSTNADAENALRVVQAYKDHPALLMFAIGNEWDINRYYGRFSSLNEAAIFTENLAKQIKALDPHHAISTISGDPHIIGYHPLSAASFPYYPGPYMEEIVNQMVPSIDVWGINVYRGAAFGEVFRQWRSISDKPVIISEFGIDSYDHRINNQNQDLQAKLVSEMWDEVYFELSAERINGSALGALVFEWNDEYWKNGAADQHNTSFESNFGQPDGINDEEWFGLVDIFRTPKKVLGVLSNRFKYPLANIHLKNAPVLRVTSQGYANGQSLFEIDEKGVYRRTGGQGSGRGINVAVLDQYTGIRMLEVRNFDTWINTSNMNSLVEYLKSLPNGAIVALSICDEGGLREPGLSYFEGLGSQKIRQVKQWGSWVFIYKKGAGVIAEAFNEPGLASVVEAQIDIRTTVDIYEYMRGFDPPVIEITSNVPAITGDPTLNVEYFVDGIPKSKNFSLIDGKNQLEIIEANSLGATSSTTFDVVLDRTPPEGFLLVNNLIRFEKDAFYTASALFNDLVNEEMSIRLSFDKGLTWSGWSSWLTSISGDISLEMSNAPSLEVYYEIKDGVGNSRIGIEKFSREIPPRILDVTFGNGNLIMKTISGSGNQLKPTSISGVDRITIESSEPLVGVTGGVFLKGDKIKNYQLSDLIESPNEKHGLTFMYSWKVSPRIDLDQLMLIVTDQVVDQSFNKLDGDWVNPTTYDQLLSQSFPSGNAMTGGHFNFRFNIMAGDLNGDVRVNLSDFATLKNGLGLNHSEVTQLRGDINGDLQIDLADYQELKKTFGENQRVLAAVGE